MEKKYIYYVYPDYIDEFEWGETDENVFRNLVAEGKAEKYTIENFVQAFNNEYISDLGMLYYM